jgi:hypothetical protein
LGILEWTIPYGTKGVYEVHGQQCYQHIFSRMLRIVVLFQQMLVLEPERDSESLVQKLLSPAMACDLSLARLFVHWLGIFPVGTFVQLRTGEVGQVCSTNFGFNEEARPLIGVFKDAEGNLLDQPQILDLNKTAPQNSENYMAAIQKSVNSEKIPEEKIALLGSAMLVALSH